MDGTELYLIATQRRIAITTRNIRGKAYQYACINDSEFNGVPKGVPVHRLVGLAWLANADNKPVLRHKDGNTLNNKAFNLEYIDFKDIKREKVGNHWRKGVKHSNAAKQYISEGNSGENHPKFRGWYWIDGKKYASLSAAYKQTNIDKRKILKECENPNNPFIKFIPKQ